MQLVDIRTALAAAAGTVQAVNKPLKTFAYVPDSVVPPALYVGLVGIEYDRTFSRGYDLATFTLVLVVGRTDDKASQQKLDEFLSSGARSIKTAVETDRTLGGVAETLRLADATNVGYHDVGGTEYLGAEFAVSVWARGI